MDGLRPLHLRRRGWFAWFDPAPEAIEYGLSKGLNVKHAGIGMDVFEGSV